MIELFGIPNCDTVRRARAWLDQAGVSYRFNDLKKTGVGADQLQQWAGAVGWERLLNRQGSTWRKLDPQLQASAVDESSACALMSQHPSLIKRPVVRWSSTITVGFDPQIFRQQADAG